MEKEMYMQYREEKWEQFFSVMSRHFSYSVDEQLLLKLGFMKGLDTATKGGQFVNR